jgi:hypothetical protein
MKKILGFVPERVFMVLVGIITITIIVAWSLWSWARWSEPRNTNHIING